MGTSSDSDNQDDNEQSKILEQQSNDNLTRSLSKGNISSTKQCVKNRFPTYVKLPGATDFGREYEQVMCAYYALKLIDRDDVEDFEMTTNNIEYGLFDDVVFKVTFKSKKTITFLFQLKHKETPKSITKKELFSEKAKGDFDVQKYLKSISSTSTTAEDVVRILCTNSSTNIEQNIQLSENINVEICDYLEYEDLLLNTAEGQTSSVLQILENKNRMFYFFTKQNNIHNTKTRVQKLLQELLQCNVYDSFMHFMSEWSSKNFVLRKNDVIAKLIELTVAPYTTALGDSKKEAKTEFLKKAIMDFPITIMKKSNEDIVQNIWPNEDIPDEEFSKTKEKFGLKFSEYVKISWYLDKLPLIVKVDDSNKTTIKHVTKLMNKMSEHKRLIFVGNVTKAELEGKEIFENLFDLVNKCKNTEHCDSILRTFKVSLQGRKPICLEEFMKIDNKIAEHIEIGELLKMSQTNVTIGNKLEKLSKLHIPRCVSTVFVKTEKILTIYEKQKYKTVVIINCEITFKDKFLPHNSFHCIELCDYLDKEYNENENVIIFSTKRTCTLAEFTRVCEKSKKSNVYLFQKFDDECCVLVSKKGYELPSEVISKSRDISEKKILKYFDNPLNVICAPPGMGKTTLMKVLYNTCPSNYWGIYVDLINCNSFRTKERDFKKMWDNFLRTEGTKQESLEEKVKDILQSNKMMYLYLDGLDEVDSSYVDTVLEFIKKASSDGIKLWISSRENLRETLSHILYVVPIEMQELSKEQQEEYIHNKLEEKYEKEEIDKILHAIFDSVDLNNSQRLLGIPLQLHIITEMFLNNKDAYRNIKEKNIFVLTRMYKKFFYGIIKSAFSKVVDENHMHQLGNLKSSLLKRYEIVALKACLDRKDFNKLNLNLKQSKKFIGKIKLSSDKYGIIKKINESGDAIFDHQTYAEYFACVWLKENKEKTALLGKQIFSERYQNLRLMFDVMLAENNPLHLSIIYKNTHQFQHRMDEINTKDEGGRTPLHLICTYGLKYPVSCFDSSEELLKLNRESEWYTFMIKTIVKNQSDIIDKDELFQFSYVKYSLEAKCLYPIEILLESKLLTFKDIKETIFEYYEPKILAYYAAQMNYPNLFSGIVQEKSELMLTKVGNEYLWETAIIGTKENASVYTYNAMENYKSKIKLFAQHNFDLNGRYKYNTTALERACLYGIYEVVQTLLENGASSNIIDKDGNNALHYAARSWQDNQNILKILIEQGIDVNSRNKNGTTCLQYACEEGVSESAKVLLENHAFINALDNQKNTALHYASRSWKINTDTIMLLIENYIDVNAQNENGMTPLHLACQERVYENAKMLLDNGASANIVDKDNNNALHYASRPWKDNRNIIKLLIERDIDVNAPNNNGTTALQFACKKGVCENAEILLECGASINSVDKDDKNALHYASDSWEDNRDVIKLLIVKGIDVEAQNKN